MKSEIKGSRLSMRSASRRTVLLGASAAAIVAAFDRLGGPAAAQSLNAIKVSEAIHLGMYVSVYAAKHGGFFKKHGLDVAVSSAGGIALALPVVLSGNASFAVTGAGMSVNAVKEGAKVANIAKVVGGVAMWAVAKPGSAVKTVADFKGKTIATLRFPSSTIQTPTFAMKERGGFEPDSAGVKFLQLPPGAQAQAVLDGRADFATMFEWDVSIAKEKFGLVPVFAFADIIGPLSWTTAMTQRSVIEKDPAMVQAFCDALAEAQAALHTDPELFVKSSVAEFPQVSESVIRAAAGNLLGNSTAIPKSPTISKQEWDADMAFELAGGSIKEARPYEEMVDNSFAEKAAAKLGKAG
ncbi:MULTISPECIES: ABC transporter substrate-binding protein [Rhodopseudomonas]|uniref:Nitrate ABC transporter n=1 Tax=Rhodopseudomonas palustris TaxID=1076 RepID=A0A0D7EMW8_RHOPL|nr:MULTISPECIES: ABC transporter substrate-binding protein [Rhodopseudomonas]KIZ41895.1 nitrate ABC transporter [Rhodopseudomonas palustris]MDF3812728.1 ABC transporter substrate-binding protein [Rhodopseudomonas sp. BAL398]WOK15790.1 ABC transporter substrate-binding protein [Rhodopseudomonas sp. BAL398]